jgi:hypothetical protein
MEKKENRTGAIIGTVVAVLLCGCPGLSLCLGGLLTVFNVMPWNGTLNGTYYTNLPSWIGFVLMCVSLFLIAIPIVVGIVTLRKKKLPAPAPVDMMPPSEPLPPAS